MTMSRLSQNSLAPQTKIPYANFSNTATGTYTSSGVNYKYVSFTSSGTLVVTDSGYADFLLVGGGAPGDNGTQNGNGGDVWAGSVYLTAGNLTVTVGTAGSSYSTDPLGKPSALGSITTAVAYRSPSGAGIGIGAGGTNASAALGYVSDITGSSLTYARGAAGSPVANRGDGGVPNGAGSDGIVIVRVRTN